MAAVGDGTDTIINVEQLNFANPAAPGGFDVVFLTPPATPSIVSAIALNGAAFITWSQPTGGAAVTSFDILVFQNGNLVRTVNAPSTDTSSTISNLTNGTTYTFQVRANSLGGSATSASSGPVTPQASVPGAPTIGNATGGVGTASITWVAPATDGGATIQSYLVEALNTANTVVGTKVVPAPATSTSLTLAAGSVRFRVSATNSVGTGLTSGLSNTVTVTSDTTAPVVATRSPLAAATNVAVGTTVTATFSEAVQGVSGTTFTLRIGTAAPIAATVTMNAANTVATLTPSAPLANNTTYTATLTGGATAIRDLAGNPLATTTWTFRTVADVIAPTVTSRSPAPGATGVAVGTNVVVGFSEPVTVPNNGFTLTNQANGRRINAAVSVSPDGRTATLNPNANLPAGTNFRVDPPTPSGTRPGTG